MADASNYNNFLISLVKNEILPCYRVVDFGAGIGTFAKSISSFGFDVDCVEPDSKQISVIESLGFIVFSDISQIEDHSVDLIYTLNVLEHIEDDFDVLTQCFNKIKPGGYLLIYVPAFKILFSSMDFLVGHFRRYSRKDLTDKVTNAGFNISRCEFVDSIGFFASLIFKIFGNKNGTINRNALITYDRYIFPFSRLLDTFMHHLLGKNIFIVARKPF